MVEETEFVTKEDAKRYLEEQEATDLTPGTIVKITRKAETGEGGWDNTWIDDFDNLIGKHGIVVETAEEKGLRIVIGQDIPTFMGMIRPYAFPYFILEKVEL